MMESAIQLNEGEEIIKTVRRHWFPLAVEGAVDIVIFTVLIAIVAIVGTVTSASGTASALGSVVPLGLFAIGFVGLLLWMHFFASWSDHWLDAWVITNRRIIDIEQHGFFHREVSSFPLERIQDVTYDISGIIAMWLHFGDVRVQTASISENFVMRLVPFPQDVKEYLLEVLAARKEQIGTQTQ
jgi:uncharacterized membrane protein YdbT with pleckstrin-like domain